MSAISDKIRKAIIPFWIPDIYIREIRPMRTRSMEMPLPERENTPLIQETLLGYELKVGNNRLACPNLETAAYLAVFARLGCRSIAVPYDITSIPPLRTKLEAAWKVTESSIIDATAELSPQQMGKERAAIIRTIREEIKLAGSGELMPLFNRSTRQRT